MHISHVGRGDRISRPPGAEPIGVRFHQDVAFRGQPAKRVLRLSTIPFAENGGHEILRVAIETLNREHPHIRLPGND